MYSPEIFWQTFVFSLHMCTPEQLPLRSCFFILKNKYFALFLKRSYCCLENLQQKGSCSRQSVKICSILISTWTRFNLTIEIKQLEAGCIYACSPIPPNLIYTFCKIFLQICVKLLTNLWKMNPTKFFWILVCKPNLAYFTYKYSSKNWLNMIAKILGLLNYFD
jgi:hypothetical protein